MTTMREHAAEYLRLRRALGFKLTTTEHRLNGFCDWLEEHHLDGFTAAQAIEWAKSPTSGASTRATRLSSVRPFAAYLAGLGLPVGIPDARALPAPNRRAVPFLYSQQDLDDLTGCCAGLFARYRLTAVTMATVVGLLAATGMRLGEVIGLDEADLDSDALTLLVRGAKFGKDRIIPVHATTAEAVNDYLASPEQKKTGRYRGGPLFVTFKGTRLRAASIQARYRQMTAHTGVGAAIGAKPRLHDWRHSFAVRAMIDAYRNDQDPAATLTVLATWLGHTNPANTYWYLDNAPELLALSADRLERHQSSKTEGGQR